jgi:hypothetical protein
LAGRMFSFGLGGGTTCWYDLLFVVFRYRLLFMRLLELSCGLSDLNVRKKMP